MMDMNPDLKNHVDAITSNPEVYDFFIVIAGEGGAYFAGKTIGSEIISALAKTIVEQEGGLSTINRMQLAIFKAKELAKQMIMERAGAVH
jgi:hypothetical protein